MKHKFIGYWNQSIENPEIVFNIPHGNPEEYEMVTIEIETLPCSTKPEKIIKSVSKKAKKLEKSLAKALKNL